MFRFIADILSWVLSKALVVFVIVIATVIVTLAVRYHAQQEQLLGLKSAKEKELQQLRAKVAQAEARSKEAAEGFKAVSDRLAKPQEELEAIREKLATNSSQLASALKQLTVLEDDLQRRTADARAKARALADKTKEVFSARALLQELERTKPDRVRHPIDYFFTWRPSWNAAVALVEEVQGVLARTEALADRAEKAKATAQDQYAKTKQQVDILIQQTGQAKQWLQAVEAQVSAMLPDKANATLALESAEQQEQELRASEKTVLEVLTDLAGRVQWYENMRAEVIRAFNASLTTIIWLVAVVFFGPAALKVFWFYIVAPLAFFAPPVRYETNASGSAIKMEEGRTLEAPINKEGGLASRPDWVKTWPPLARRRTKLLWNWHAPMISYAAGLRELTCFSADDADVAATVTLGAGTDPNMHLLRLDLTNHPGFVLRPGYVVATAGNLGVRTKWNLINLNAWVCGSFRKILFCGTGTLYICGYGGVSAIDCSESPRNVEEDFVIGHDARSAFRIVRTETFWPYFRDMTSLFDYSFRGPGLTLSEIARSPGTTTSANPLKRIIDAIFNVIGKLLGF